MTNLFLGFGGKKTQPAWNIRQQIFKVGFNTVTGEISMYPVLKKKMSLNRRFKTGDPHKFLKALKLVVRKFVRRDS